MRAIAVLILAAVMMQGCAIVRSPVGNGLLLTNVEGPVDSGVSSKATKSGESCSENYLGLVATGDSSIATAKNMGQITSVASVDHESYSVLSLYSRFCTVVRGE